MPSRAAEDGFHTNLSTHMVDHAFHLLINKQVENVHKDYLEVDVHDVTISKFNLPKDYVVVCTGFTSNAREFYPKHINQITRYLVSKGYTPVFLGKTVTSDGYKYTITGQFKEDIDYSIGINLIDKCSLIETTKIIYNAKTIVGLDNGLLHVASTHPELPVVGGFSSVDPKHRMAYRGGGILGYQYYPVVPPESLKCRGCQSHMIFEYDHSFTECVYKDYQCLDLMNADLYIAQLERIL